MNINSLEYRQAVNYGTRLIGKTAQSVILTEIDVRGQMIARKPAKITAFEIVEQFMQPELMVIIDGESVLETTLFNISR